LTGIAIEAISVEKLKALRFPVLTIHGTKDRNAPYGGGRQWSMLLSESRLVTVPRAAHMSWIEAPELVFSSIDAFLNGDWPTTSERVNAFRASRPNVVGQTLQPKNKT
jgi:alpha-beta hydrolase superfamily lysophospholipase